MTRKQKSKVLVYLVLALCSIVVAYPFVFMLLNSFKTGQDIINSPYGLPHVWTVQGYVKVIQELNLGVMFKNSIIIALSVTGLNVGLNAMVAYAMSKLEFPGRGLLFSVIVGSMMVPVVLLMIPTYSMYYNWGWINNFIVVILPAGLSAYNIFLVRQFMITIPNELLEASRLDGSGEFRTFWSIVLPLSMPVLSTVAILAFMGSWNDLINPLLYLEDRSKFTLQLGIYSIRTEIPGQNVDQLWAGLAITTVPVAIVFFFLQRYFVRAFTGIGLK
ncbi:sugar ABC transporter permease [Cohnella kolymensis]|uniref:Sugar ABC transporter permease n=1 Tax=Cohnella kolymensis TaxID=1590652 RepID=A0ABR4ZZZ4_9BACL|nr:carbohydrate ABC transporter permease [Cohnella kolymensis]KIL34296.1 sugar ABC transporter permease [Cohnella kolymensis]